VFNRVRTVRNQDIHAPPRIHDLSMSHTPAACPSSPRPIHPFQLTQPTTHHAQTLPSDAIRHHCCASTTEFHGRKQASSLAIACSPSSRGCIAVSSCTGVAAALFRFRGDVRGMSRQGGVEPVAGMVDGGCPGAELVYLMAT